MNSEVRYRRRGYGHKVSRAPYGGYVLRWSWDRYYKGQVMRYPQGLARDTDFAGAVRFAKKWRIDASRLPEEVASALTGGG